MIRMVTMTALILFFISLVFAQTTVKILPDKQATIGESYPGIMKIPAEQRERTALYIRIQALNADHADSKKWLEEQGIDASEIAETIPENWNGTLKDLLEAETAFKERTAQSAISEAENAPIKTRKQISLPTIKVPPDKNDESAEPDSQ